MSALKPTAATESTFRFGRDLDASIDWASKMHLRFADDHDACHGMLEFMKPGQERERIERWRASFERARCVALDLIKVGNWLRTWVREHDATLARLRSLDSPVARDIVSRCARAEEVAERNAKERDATEAELTRLRAALQSIAALQTEEPERAPWDSTDAVISAAGQRWGRFEAAEMARKELVSR